jgi:hypothetical protein
MVKFNYPKGSEWRKWDLQACTRFYTHYQGSSFSAEQLDNLNRLTGIDKSKINSEHQDLTDEEYAKLYVEYLVNYTDLALIAIANHNTGKGIQEILDYLSSKQNDDKDNPYNRLNILPGVEIGASDRCHIVIIFNNKTNNKNKFEWAPDGTTQIRELNWFEYIEKFLNKIEIPPNRFDHNNPTNSLKYCTIEIINLHSEWDFIPVFPHIDDNNGWYKELGESNRKNSFNHSIFGITDIKSCSGNSDLMTILGGQKEEYGKKIVAKIHTSDAKSISQIGKDFVWIKADPTFEGLNQIIYEPKERVNIQEAKPEEKKPYYVIDKVRFIDNTGKNEFPSDYIDINSNLNGIVGGKSTGKSLLLYYIAKTIDQNEVCEKFKNFSKQLKKYPFDEQLNFNFEVLWKDGESTYLKPQISTTGKDISERKIVYIPQNYLNELSEISISSRETINKFILGVLIQNQEAKDKFDKFNQGVELLEQRISKGINELASLKNDIAQSEIELKECGDEKGVLNYINELNVDIERIKIDSGLSAEQISSYKILAEQFRQVKTVLANLGHDKSIIEEFNQKLIGAYFDIDNLRSQYSNYLLNEEIKKQFNENYKVLDLLQEQLVQSKQYIVSKLDSNHKEQSVKLKETEKEIAPLLAKVKLQSELQKKMQLLKLEQDKLTKISQFQSDLKNKKKNEQEKESEILKQYGEIVNLHDNLKSEFKKYEGDLKDLQLSIVTNFDENDFNQNLVNTFLNKNNLKTVLPNYEYEEVFVYKYDPFTHLKAIETIFYGLLKGSIKTLRERNIKDALLKLFENRFYIDFKITFKEDAIDKMSPGKKGLVLLKLLIELSQDEWPILLDQPEDDLDNRSVYHDLVTFLREKKIHRQMIIVTHNPNLVVGGDSEEIIVANQAGQEVGRENAKYKFEYVTGSLENSGEDESAKGILYQKGVRQHVCEILEGGKEAFQKRENKYNF